MARMQGLTRGGGLLARISFLFTHWRMGKVVTPLRIHALSTGVLWGMTQMQTGQELASKLSRRLKLLAQLRVAWLVGCPF
ncbi:MAG: hypothetical protein AB7S38_23435 [Vulcanimicrobiota bacterium]